MDKNEKRSVESVMSLGELARLGGGELAYIKELTSDEAGKLFPKIKGIPKGINLYALHAADGTPIALTDTLQAAIGHAIEDDLTVSSVH
jgi:hypothetical protein